MPTNEDPVTGKTPEGEPIREVIPPAPNTPTIYANHAQVEISKWDVRLRLGLLAGVKDQTLIVNEVAIVYMSHSHARAFAQALTKTMDRLGELPLLEAGENAKGKAD